jgi:CheY-like chemotaxis protein
MRSHFNEVEQGAEMGKILVVDDDIGCRRLTAKVLSIYGFSAIPAANGLEALAALRREQIDMILLDLMMPEMDGISFVRAMRKDPRWASVPVLVISGVADFEFAKGIRESGVQGYLVKSRYSIDELIKQVRSHMPEVESPQHANP